MKNDRRSEIVAFRATPHERLILEQFVQRSQATKSVVLRELVHQEAVAQGLLPNTKKAPAKVPGQYGGCHEQQP